MSTVNKKSFRKLEHILKVNKQKKQQFVRSWNKRVTRNAQQGKNMSNICRMISFSKR